MSGRLQYWGTALALMVLAVAIYFTGPMRAGKVLHADEAVQWSLARDLNEGVPYSLNEDRFHGPTLALATLVAARVTGVGFNEMSPEFLGGISRVFFFLLALASLAVPDLSAGRRWLGAAVCFLTGACTPYSFYYVQEILLVTGLVWSVVLWMRWSARSSEHPRRLLPWLSGAAFGFAGACKVTAVAYLLLFLGAVWVLRRDSFRRGGLVGFVLGALLAWGFFQSVALTDGAGLVTWVKQLRRAFGVAAGTSADTLTTADYGAWYWATIWLGGFGLLRWFRRAEWGRWGQAAVDLPLFFAALLFLFHLALPYKTPWLLLGATALPLVLAGPSLFRADWLGWLALTVLLPLAAWQSTVFQHTPTEARVPRLAADLEAMAQAYGASRFTVAVEGGHYWPLPYYLRHLRVGYGPFEGSERAPVRLIAVTDGAEPAVAGYVTRRFSLRAGEDYWLLIAKGYEGHLMLFR